MDVTLELFSTTSPGVTLASRSVAVADAWELEAERQTATTAFDAFLAEHGGRLRLRSVLASADPATITYARFRTPI